MIIENIPVKFTPIELIKFGFKKHYFKKNNIEHDYRFIIDNNTSINTKVLKNNYNDLTELEVALFNWK